MDEVERAAKYLEECKRRERLTRITKAMGTGFKGDWERACANLDKAVRQYRDAYYRVFEKEKVFRLR